MITEINLVDPEIVPGIKIDCVNYNVRNYRMRDTLEMASRLLLFAIECDTNNTNATVIPSDARDILDQWAVCKEEFDFAIQFNDFPKGSHEFAYQIAILAGKEIQRIRNVAMKTVVAELFNALRVLLSVDSASTQGYISARDQVKVKRMFEIVDAKMARWLGDGSVGDTGRNSPAFEELGQIRPDIDSDFAQMLEPSRGMPVPKLPDVPDTDGKGK
jgi:hypothetical protein